MFVLWRPNLRFKTGFSNNLGMHLQVSQLGGKTLLCTFSTRNAGVFHKGKATGHTIIQAVQLLQHRKKHLRSEIWRLLLLSGGRRLLLPQ